MIEKVLKISLAELDRVRIACKCGAVSELSVSTLEKRGGVRCHGCGVQHRQPCNPQGDPPPEDALDELAKVFTKLSDPEARFHIEFNIPLRQG